MRKTLFALFLVMSAYVYGQRPVYVPDFGLTDSFGNTQFIYDDVLNQGKTAVLVFFSVSCQSCQVAVHAIDSMYYVYGENQENVVFWGIEVSDFSSYDDVTEFGDTYGANYPLWNTNPEDSVVDLLDILYTPNYFVACPDGSVRKYDFDNVSNAIEYCIQTSFDQPEVENQILLFSVDGELYLDNATNSEYTIEVFSMDGRKVLCFKMSDNEKRKPNLNLGLYVFRIFDQAGTLLSSGKFNH